MVDDDKWCMELAPSVRGICVHYTLSLALTLAPSYCPSNPGRDLWYQSVMWQRMRMPPVFHTEGSPQDHVSPLKLKFPPSSSRFPPQAQVSPSSFTDFGVVIHLVLLSHPNSMRFPPSLVLRLYNIFSLHKKEGEPGIQFHVTNVGMTSWKRGSQQLSILNRSANFSLSNTDLWGLQGSYDICLKALAPYLPSTSNWNTWKV